MDFGTWVQFCPIALTCLKNVPWFTKSLYTHILANCRLSLIAVHMHHYLLIYKTIYWKSIIELRLAQMSYLVYTNKSNFQTMAQETQNKSELFFFFCYFVLWKIFVIFFVLFGYDQNIFSHWSMFKVTFSHCV